MADQQNPAPTAPPESAAEGQPPTTQVPLPPLVAEGMYSPTTEKQVADLLAEMQQRAQTATPGTTTTMQFSYQKSKHTKEATGEEPQVSESKHVEKSLHQTPPAGQAPQQQPQQPPQPQPAQTQFQPQQPFEQGQSILGQLPQYLQEKLGLASSTAPGSQLTQVSYQHSKKTTTTSTTTTAGGDQQTVTTESYEHPQQTATTQEPGQGQPQPQPQPQSQPQPQPQPQPATAQEPTGLFAKLQEQMSHLPQLFQFAGAQAAPATDVQTGQQQYELQYQHSKKTTTTTSSSTSSGDQQQVINSVPQQTAPPQTAPTIGTGQPSPAAPINTAAEQVTSGLEHMLEQAAKAFPQPVVSDGNMKIEFSKHASRQVLKQSGEQLPHIETTSSGFTQVVQGIFNGVPVVGSVVPMVVPISVSKSSADSTDTVFQQTAQSQQAAPPPPSAGTQPTASGMPPGPTATTTGPTTVTIDPSANLEEQLKKLGISTGPVTELLQHTLAQHQRAKTPETNIEIQYSAQRTHSSRTVTYEGSSTDTKTTPAVQQQTASPSQTVPTEPSANASEQKECVEDKHFDDDGNLVITKKVTRVVRSKKTVYDDGGEQGVSESVEKKDVGEQPPFNQGQ